MVVSELAVGSRSLRLGYGDAWKTGCKRAAARVGFGCGRNNLKVG